MNNLAKRIVIAMGILLLLFGLGNIWDDSRVLVYDLTAIFAGVGFIFVARMK